MIRVEDEGPVRIITLDRAEKRNALTPPMLSRLADAAEDLGSTDSRAVLVRGEGKVFCAGFDLDECRGDTSGEVMRAFMNELSRAIAAMRSAPMPVVLCAHGAAVAGGCALLGGADVVVADPAAKLGYPVVRLGISPAVSAPFLRLGAGDGSCRVRMLDPGLIDGARAAEIGLVHELAEDASSRAREIAASLAAKPRDAVRATKRLLNEISPTITSAQLGLTTSLSLTSGDEAHELLERFWQRKAAT
ncbi:MAG: enoyl-CoA hydratase/isomerase family protein [Planctomycetota bacterium]